MVAESGSCPVNGLPETENVVPGGCDVGVMIVTVALAALAQSATAAVAAEIETMPLMSNFLRQFDA